MSTPNSAGNFLASPPVPVSGLNIFTSSKAATYGRGPLSVSLRGQDSVGNITSVDMGGITFGDDDAGTATVQLNPYLIACEDFSPGGGSNEFLLPPNLINFYGSNLASLSSEGTLIFENFPTTFVNCDIHGTKFSATDDFTASYLTRFDAHECTGLVSIDALPETLTYINISNCSALTDIGNLPSSLVTIFASNSDAITFADADNPVFDLGGLQNVSQIEMVSCALSAEAVSAILDALATSSVIDGTVDLTGGSNEAVDDSDPMTGPGLAKATLEGRGWTVSVNEL